MKEAIKKTEILIEALPYIQKFKNRIVVIKYGGSAMAEAGVDEGILKDIAFMRAVGMCPVVVHGGGKHISKAMEKEGIAPNFVKGLRVTDEHTMRVVEDVLVNEVNAKLVEKLRELACPAEPLVAKHTHTICVDKLKGQDENGNPFDWGFVGKVRRINPRRIFETIMNGSVPVVAPIGRDQKGHAYNVNADIAASEIAGCLSAEKLVFLTNVPGLLRDPEDPKSLISSVHMSEIPKLVKEGIIKGGMIPKVEACLEAMKNNVKTTHIVGGDIPHSLLLEIFTDRGIGTQFLSD
ncbi:acetylglutamate kinase [bacterium]|nr:acetylglutamate kinase [bacterium]